MTIGMPGDPHGITDWMPTIADVMKMQGYATAQFGKHHLGDRDQHLPTKHGFDEFFGNLYHLNAEEEPEGYYFDQGGNLNAIRWNDWKLSFAVAHGNIATGVRESPAWALIANLRMDPYEKGLEDGGGAIDFLARNMWLIVPVGAKVKEFFSDFDEFPYQSGSTLNPGGINHAYLRQADALKRLKEMESMAAPRN